MNFGKFDITMILTMSLAVICMSFVFPAVGLADAGTDDSEIPEYTLDTQALDLAGDFPASPGTPSRGTLSLDTSEGASFSNNQVWLDGDTSGGTEMAILPAVSSNDNAELLVTSWDSGNASEVRFNITSADDAFAVNQFGYTMAIEVTEFDESGGYDDAYYEIEYEIQDQIASAGGWLDRIPVVGGIVGAGEAAAAVLAWVGSIFWWFFATTIDLISAATVMLYDTASFVIALLSWLVTTYASIVENAGPSWVSLFVALPGIILSLEFGKLGMIAVSLLPTT